MPRRGARVTRLGFMSDSQQLAYRTYEEMAYLAAGLIGIRRPAPIFHGAAMYRAQ